MVIKGCEKGGKVPDAPINIEERPSRGNNMVKDPLWDVPSSDIADIADMISRCQLCQLCLTMPMLAKS